MLAYSFAAKAKLKYQANRPCSMAQEQSALLFCRPSPLFALSNEAEAAQRASTNNAKKQAFPLR